MRSQLAGKVAIVTGGASGIGRALSEELAARGCEVVVADRQIEVARELEAQLRKGGRTVTATELDVRDRGAFEQVVRETLGCSRRIDFLFNNAGIGVGGEVSTYEPADFDDVFDVNLRGVAWGIQAVYPVMIAQGSGHIVNTASMAGLIPAPGSGSYSATKHAVVGLTKALRIEARQHGVRVSALCPGVIRTPILNGGRYGRLGKLRVTEEAAAKLWEQARPMAPDVFARRALDRVLANEALIVLPRWWKALWYLDRISPSVSMAVLQRAYDKVYADIGTVRASPGSRTHDRGAPTPSRRRSPLN